MPSLAGSFSPTQSTEATSHAPSGRPNHQDIFGDDLIFDLRAACSLSRLPVPHTSNAIQGNYVSHLVTFGMCLSVPDPAAAAFAIGCAGLWPLPAWHLVDPVEIMEKYQ